MCIWYAEVDEERSKFEVQATDYEPAAKLVEAGTPLPRERGMLLTTVGKSNHLRHLICVHPVDHAFP